MHFTYNENPNKNSLCQGDVLNITEEIRGVLKEIHPYFLKNEYKYFMVLTQSCDLVRRKKNKCRSDYITLAAVRSYDDFINRKASLFKIKEIRKLKLLEEPNDERFKQLIERLYNNNEPEHFFLAKEPEFNIYENMVAYLKVSIALKSGMHYDKCLKAKVLELNDEFKAKLGWLVGDMYSRVGTRDWMNEMEREEFLEMIKNDLKERFIISSKKKLNAIKGNIEKEEMEFKDINELQIYLDSLEIKSNYEEIMDIIDDIVNNQANLGNDEERKKLIRKIRSNQQLKSYIK